MQPDLGAQLSKEAQRHRENAQEAKTFLDCITETGSVKGRRVGGSLRHKEASNRKARRAEQERETYIATLAAVDAGGNLNLTHPAVEI